MSIGVVIANIPYRVLDWLHQNTDGSWFLTRTYVNFNRILQYIDAQDQEIYKFIICCHKWNHCIIHGCNSNFYLWPFSSRISKNLKFKHYNNILYYAYNWKKLRKHWPHWCPQEISSAKYISKWHTKETQKLPTEWVVYSPNFQFYFLVPVLVSSSSVYF